ncbi:MAG: hypothetical protein ACTH2X_07120 [Brachybacterium tyrofermentans]
MIRVLELLGLLAPFAGLALLVVCRRSMPPVAMTFGVTGCLFAALSSLVGLIGKRALPFGALEGGGAEGMSNLLGTASVLRLGLLAAAIAMLTVAALTGRSDRRPTLPWLTAAVVLLMFGLLVTIPAAELEHLMTLHDRSGLALVVALLGETVEFGALGLAILALTIAVTTRRRDPSEGRDSTVMVADTARAAWTAYRSLRGPRGTGPTRR